MIITKLAPAKFLSAELTALQINVASVSKIIKLITHKKELMQQKISDAGFSTKRLRFKIVVENC